MLAGCELHEVVGKKYVDVNEEVTKEEIMKFECTCVKELNQEEIDRWEEFWE